MDFIFPSLLSETIANACPARLWVRGIRAPFLRPKNLLPPEERIHGRRLLRRGLFFQHLAEGGAKQGAAGGLGQGDVRGPGGRGQCVALVHYLTDP